MACVRNVAMGDGMGVLGDGWAGGACHCPGYTAVAFRATELDFCRVVAGAARAVTASSHSPRSHRTRDRMTDRET
jgi:hypothetical protein